MDTVNITVENIKKAHSEGCSDVRRVLETIAPEVFKTKFPCFAKGNPSTAIYLFLSEDQAIRLTEGSRGSGVAGVIGERTHLSYSGQIPIKGIMEER
jgi:hypothetical protein